MRESMLCQTLNVRIANVTQKIQSLIGPWCFVLWCGIISHFLLDFTSFWMVWQMVCWYFNSQTTVKLFNFIGMKFHGLSTLNMFVNTWICGFQIICNITQVYKFFVGILNSWIALSTKYTKLNVQRIFIIPQYYDLAWFLGPGGPPESQREQGRGGEKDVWRPERQVPPCKRHD